MSFSTAQPTHRLRNSKLHQAEELFKILGLYKVEWVNSSKYYPHGIFPNEKIPILINPTDLRTTELKGYHPFLRTCDLCYLEVVLATVIFKSLYRSRRYL
ncbi:hypothetical protein HHI36_005386 [Cryptolaemus montrouzieri]|uniref:Uncharacterized protein n=1 Tax=Cryptolaemus montrouzieri TaxID=559131 RepID=A0ABD2NUW4_9CUCU